MPPVPESKRGTKNTNQIIMITLPNTPTYTEIKKENGNKYLFDSYAFGQRCRQLEEIQGIYNRAVSLLRDSGYPPSWASAVVSDGYDGLVTKIKEDTAKRMSPIDMPRAVSRYWQQLAVDDIAPEVAKECDAIRFEAVKRRDGLPLSDSDIAITDDGVTIDTQAVTDRIRQGCTLEVTSEAETVAKKLSEMAKEVKALEFDGINSREIIGKIVTSKEEVSELTLLTLVATRRHQPGCLAVDYGLVQNIGTNFSLNQPNK